MVIINSCQIRNLTILLIYIENSSRELKRNEVLLTIFNCTKLLGNIIVHILMLGLTIFVTWVSFGDGVVLFAWHPTLMIIGVSRMKNKQLIFLRIYFLVFPINDRSHINIYQFKYFITWH